MPVLWVCASKTRMNSQCFKNVFSKRLGCLVAVGEHARSQGQANGASMGRLVVLYAAQLTVACVLVSMAWAGPAGSVSPVALPAGGQLAQGVATVQQSGAVMNINQSSSKAVMNWNSFDIGQNATVNIFQPGTSAVMLNRVTSANPSQILGQLNANGQVVLVNPNGVLFGKDGSVNASSFTASTLGITDANFMAGNHLFERNGSTASVVNQGSIKTTGGYVALLGASVTNEGQIQTQGGTAYLAAAETIKIPVSGSGRIKLELSPSRINSAVANAKGGTIVTEGGQVYMQAAALSSAVASILQSGSIDTTGEQGGAVHLLADGGTIKADGSITANSLSKDDQDQQRKGADIVIGRDEETGVLAKAADVSGAKLESMGGFVETSGHQLNVDGAKVKASNWLLDPDNIDITGDASAATAGYSKLKASDIAMALNAGTSVTVATTVANQSNQPAYKDTAGTGPGTAVTGDGNILVNAAIVKTTTTAATLTLSADNGITVNQRIGRASGDTSSNTLTVSMTALGNAATVTNSSGITLNNVIDAGSGNVTLTGTNKNTNGNSRGVAFANNSGIIANTITVTGTAIGAAEWNQGVFFSGTSSIKATGTGSSVISGISSSSAGAINSAVVFNDGSTVTLDGGTGGLTVQGTHTVGGYGGIRFGANGGSSTNPSLTTRGNVTLGTQDTNNASLNASFMVRNGLITADTGSLTIKGQGTGTGITFYDSYGVVKSNGASIALNGVATSSGHGVLVTGNQIGTLNSGGDVTITGTSSGNGNKGVNFTGGNVRVYGNNVTINGTANTTSGQTSYGFYSFIGPGAGNTITAAGNLSITGTVNGGGSGTAVSHNTTSWQSFVNAYSAGGAITISGTNNASTANALSTITLAGVQASATGAVTLNANTNNNGSTAISATSAGSTPGFGYQGGSSSLVSTGGNVLIQTNQGGIYWSDQNTSTSRNISGNYVFIDNSGGSITNNVLTAGPGLASGSVNGVQFYDTRSITASAATGNGIQINGGNSSAGAGVIFSSGVSLTSPNMLINGISSSNVGVYFGAGATLTSTNTTTVTGRSTSTAGLLFSSAALGLNAANATLTGTSSSANGIYSNAALSMNVSGTATFNGNSSSVTTQQGGISFQSAVSNTAASGAINITSTDTAGGANWAYYQNAALSSGTGGITINATGSGANSALDVYGNITTTGAVNLTGNAGTGGGNGIWTSGTLTISGTSVTMNGTGGTTGGVGAYLNANTTVTATTGDVSITGSKPSSTSTAAINFAGTINGVPTKNVNLTGGLTGAGSIVTNGAAVNLNNSLSAVDNSSVVISGNGSLINQTGMQALSGTNTYSGTTTINTGKLQVGSGGATGTLGSGGVSNNGALIFNRNATTDLSVANAISGTGSVEQAGAGKTILSTNNSYSGATSVSGGILQVGNGGSTGTLGTANSVALSNNATLAFNKNVDTTIDKSISGNGNVTATITGDLALTSNIALTGTNTINLTASGAITETAGTLAATNLYLTATNGAIGAVGNRIQSNVTNLSFSAGSNAYLTEANAVTVSGRTTANNGNIDVVTTNGTMSIGSVNSINGITAHGTGNITLSGTASTGHGLSINNTVTATNGDVSLTGRTSSTVNFNAGVFSQSTVAAKNITMVAESTSTTGSLLGYYGAGGVFNASQLLSLTGTSNSAANGLYSYTGSYLSGTGMTLVGSSAGGQGMGFDRAVTVTNSTSGGINITGTATDSTKQAIGFQGVAITNGGGALAITANNGQIYSGTGDAAWGAAQTNTITNNGTGSVLVTAGNGSATNSGSIDGSVFSITQNANAGVVVSTSGTGNVTSPKIINAGTGDIVVAAGSLIAAGTATGGQVLTVAGNTLTQTNGTPGKTYVYSGAPSTTGVLSNLSTGFNNLYYQGTSVALNAGFNQGFDANHANDMTVPGGGSASGTQVFFRSATKPAFSMTLNNPSKQYGDVADPALTATAATLTNAVAGVGGNNPFGVASADVIAGMTGTRAPGSALGSYAYSLNASSFNTTLTAQPSLVIGKRDITLAAVVASNKTYDGFTTATITSGTFNNLVAGEALLISGSGVFNTKNVADNKLVTVADVSTLTKANGVGGNWNNYNLTTTNITTLANITKATLNVTANADAKFVTQGDATNVFKGVSYGPFLGTDTAAAEVNAAGLTVTRTNNANNAAGSYAGVLVASGLASTNYNFNYINGDYTIVPAGRLLVSTTNQTVAYGASPTYATTASYLDNDGVTINTLTRTGNNNNYTFNDGVGTTINFALKPYTGANVATQSASNKTVPGTYDVKDALYVQNGNNFTGTPVFVGNLTVTKSSATVTANGATLTYNGANQTATGFSATGLAAGETASVLTGVTASTTQLNAGTYTTTATGSDSNYNLTFVNGVMNIGKAALTATANSSSVTFNGGAQSVSGFTVAGLQGTDTVAGLTGISASGATGTNVGAYASTMTVADQPNYTVTGVNGALTINAAPVIPQITGSLTGSVSKVYDGTNIATLTPANYVLTGWVGADSATITKTSGTYDSANAGTNKTVTVSLSGGDFVAGAGTNLTNYLLPTFISGTVGSIGKANLTVTANSAAVVYNGANQSVSGFTVTGLRGTDTVGGLTGISASGATGTNVGTYANTMTVANQTNYNVTGINGALTIGAASLNSTLMGSVSKVYDGTNLATLNPGNYSITGWLGTDGATVTKTLGTYNNVNVGVAQTVTVSLSRSDYQGIGGTNLSNYNLPTSLTGLVGVITPKDVSLSSFSVANKVYDGNNLAIITAGTVLTGVGTETLSVKGTGIFSDKNVGVAKVVTVTDPASLIKMDGTGQWANYNLLNTPATSTAAITPKLVQAMGWVADKVYDGTAQATVSTSTLSGTLADESVYLQAGNALFVDKNVSRGTDGQVIAKSVTVSNLTLNGPDAGNYALSVDSFNAQAKIHAKVVETQLQVNNKVYDGNTLASLVDLSVKGAVSGDDVVASGGPALFADKNVSRDANGAVLAKAVTVSGLKLQGTDAKNYELVSSVAQTQAKIDAKVLDAQLQVNDKVYDGNTLASVVDLSVKGTVAGEQVGVTGDSAQFADKNVSRDASGAVLTKAVTVSGLKLQGTDSKNYDLSAIVAKTQAKISPKVLGSVDTSVVDKTFDNTNEATIKLGTVQGLVGNERLTILATGRFQSSLPEISIPVDVRFNLQDGANGGFANNYAWPDQVLMGNIFAKQNVVTTPVLEPVKTSTGGGIRVLPLTPVAPAIATDTPILIEAKSCTVTDLEPCDCEKTALDGLDVCLVPRNTQASGAMR